MSNLPPGVMDWADKFVSPKGLCHAVEGGTNCTRWASRASSQSASGIVCPAFEQSGGEAGKHRDSFCCPFEAPEEWVTVVTDDAEKTGVELPTAAALGTGARGNGCVLGSRRIKSPMPEIVAVVKGTRRKDFGNW